MTRSILVTGAGGYVGPHVVAALARSGSRVLAMDRGTTPAMAGVTSIQCDFRDFDKTILPRFGPPDVCLHMAWRDGFDHGAQSHIDSLPEHLAFLKALARAGVKQIAVIGTMHEIGYWEGEIDENTPTNPMTLYGVAKNALRQAAFIEMNKSGVCLQWLRAFYILGDDSRNKSLFSKIMTWEQEGRKTFPFTSGKNRYDFINIDDLAIQIAAAVSQTQISGLINCCSGSARRLKDQVEDFLRSHNLGIRPEYGVFPDRLYDSPAIWGSRLKIDAILTSQNILPTAKV